MPDTFLSLTEGEQRDILNTAAAQLGRPAVILEKDVWICWVLRALFSLPDRHPMAFKGGTSLSKVYGIIDRFSDDIDITLDYAAFAGDFDPFAPGISKSQIKKFADSLKSRVATYIRDAVGPPLEAEAARLGSSGHHEVRIGEDGETLRFSYPSAVEDRVDYLRSEVLLEFGGRNVIDPNELHEIAPDISAISPQIEYPRATVTVLSPLRTFWEKATLIHVACHRRRPPRETERLSRHWFDLDCLAANEVGPAALSDRELLEDVVRLKKLFFDASYAKYSDCLNGKLRLIPDDDQLGYLKADYDAMRTAGIVRSDAPAFDALIKRLQEVETRINRPS